MATLGLEFLVYECLDALGGVAFKTLALTFSGIAVFAVLTFELRACGPHRFTFHAADSSHATWANAS